MGSISRRHALGAAGAAGALSLAGTWAPPAQGQTTAAAGTGKLQSWKLATPRRTGIHDLAPAPDGGVWFTAQASGHLGWFDPKTGRTELIALGSGSSPHGVIQGPDKAAWVTDSGQNAIVRVSWPDRAVRSFPLPQGTPYANLNTAAFDGDGDLWFTGQSGYVGKVAVKTGQVSVHGRHPKGAGPTASAPRRRAMCGGARWRAASLRAWTGARVNPPWWSRPRPARARAGCGATAGAASG
jgi:virginiamycin B lyase